MPYGFLDIAVTPGVRAVQAKMGADRIWQGFKGHREFDRFTENEAAFIADRDSFYMATVSETGWPYVQHRGGPRGFLKVVDEKTLAFADYRGNRQYISVGNLAGDDRAALILMDYAGRARLKIYAQCRGRADRRRPCSCATRGRRGLQGQTRTHPAAAPHGVRLGLPTAHHRQKLARLYSRYARAWQLWKPKMLNCERPSKTRPSTQVHQTLELGG